MRSRSLLPLEVLVASGVARRPRARRRAGGHDRARVPRGGDAGQTTVEYALMVVGVAVVAALFIGWATRTGRFNDLFDFVLEQVRGRVS